MKVKRREKREAPMKEFSLYGFYVMTIHSRLLRLRCCRSVVYPERPSTSALRAYARDDRKRRAQHEWGASARPERSAAKSKGHLMDNSHRETVLLTAICCFLAYLCPAVWAADDPGWPREQTGKDGTKLIVYQPQVDSWEGHKRLHARVAVAITPPQGKKSILGVLWIEADTETM